MTVVSVYSSLFYIFLVFYKFVHLFSSCTYARCELDHHFMHSLSYYGDKKERGKNKYNLKKKLCTNGKIELDQHFVP